MLLNCGVGEEFWESLGLQGEPLVHSKGDQSWVFFARTDAKAQTPILWPPHAKSWPIGKDSDAGRDWGQEEKGTTEDEVAGMASPTQWTWVWVNFGSWWWTGRPVVLQFTGSQRVRPDWATELNWTDGCICIRVYSVTLFIVINLCLYDGLLQFCGDFLFYFFSIFILLRFFTFLFCQFSIFNFWNKSYISTCFPSLPFLLFCSPCS